MSEWIVLDSSVVVKWFIRSEPLQSPADRLFRDFKEGNHKFVVPDLLFYEVGNVLSRKWPLGVKITEITLHRLWHLPWFLMPLNASLLARTLNLAGQYGISYYDSLFLATAERADAVLYTADQAFLRKVADFPFARSLETLR